VAAAAVAGSSSSSDDKHDYHPVRDSLVPPYTNGDISL